jgi:hypothetical protein
MTTPAFVFPTLGISVQRQATLLAVDDYALPLRRNLCYYLSTPTVRPEPVLTPSRDDPTAPDHVASHFYGTVLQEGGRFRMWYYGLGWDPEPPKLREGPICYAESEDGLHFTKPDLGQLEVKGSRHNNALGLPETMTEGAFVIRDDDDPDPARRYKMVYENFPAHRRFMSARMATSPDGVHWTPGPDGPINEGVEPCSFYKHNGLYITNAQFAPSGVSEGGHAAGRQGVVCLSPDFDHWLQESGESFTLPEPQDPAVRGIDKPYQQVHLGVAPVSLGNVLVGLYCIWHALPKEGDWFGAGTTYGDWGLVVSNDGQHFREPVKGHVFLDHRASPPSAPPPVAFQTILCQGNGILTVGDETRIYHGRWVNAAQDEHYYAEIALATLPRDRWGALGLYPKASEGTLWSAPVRLPEGGCRLSLNADGARGITVEVADERFGLIPEFSGPNAGTAAPESGFEVPVTWPQADLSALAGKTVRLRLRLSREGHPEPRLFAAYLAGV